MTTPEKRLDQAVTANPLYTNYVMTLTRQLEKISKFGLREINRHDKTADGKDLYYENRGQLLFLPPTCIYVNVQRN